MKIGWYTYLVSSKRPTFSKINSDTRIITSWKGTLSLKWPFLPPSGQSEGSVGLSCRNPCSVCALEVCSWRRELRVSARRLADYNGNSLPADDPVSRKIITCPKKDYLPRPKLVQKGRYEAVHIIRRCVDAVGNKWRRRLEVINFKYANEWYMDRRPSRDLS